MASRRLAVPPRPPPPGSPPAAWALRGATSARATATGQATTAQPVSPLLALTRGGQCGPAAWGFPAPGPCPSADDRHGARLAQRDAACLKISLEVPEDSQRILC